MKTKVTMSIFRKQVVSMALAFAVLCSFAPLGAGVAEGEISGAFSQAAAAEAVQKPEASVKPGMYREPQQVVLTAQDGAQIYYTTNNLMPTENDTRYAGPITVSQDTNICAIAVKNGVKSTPVTFGYLIRGAETPQMQFIVMSDIHVGDALSVEGGTTDVYNLDKARTFKAMEVMSSIFSEPDLLVMNGDLVKHNSNSSYPSKEADHTAFINLMKDSMRAYGMEETPVQVTIGNHDSEGHDVARMKAYYDKDEVAKEWFPSDTGYYHKEVNGLDFIYLDSNHTTEAQKTFLKETLEQIQQEKGEGSPVFVFLHIPIKGTLDDEQWTCSADWKTILQDYPQAVVFSGHTHYTVSEDCSISQEAGFTAINDGCMSYIERIDANKEMMWNSTDGTLKKAYQFPVTQGLAVEVYADRIEVNRITVNADRGDAKVNDYVPVEPFDNCGVIAGEKWVIERGNSAQEWKDHFRYEKEQRKANAQTPAFRQDAKPILSGEERVATVSFPQAENAQRVDQYLIELVNESTGKTEQQMKVWSENWFSPMPETLTYEISGLEAETTYRAKVTAYNEYGAASVPILSDETYLTPAIPGRKPTLLADEDFTEPLTDEDHSRTIIPYIETYSSGGVMGDAEIQTSSGEDGAAKWVANNNGGHNLMIPFQPGTVVGEKYTPQPVLGEFFLEFDVERLSGLSGQGIGFYLRNGSVNAAKLTLTASRVNYQYYVEGSNGEATPASYVSTSVSNGAHKIRVLLGTDGNTQYLGGLWIDGKEITTKKQLISDYPSEAGWKVIAAEPDTSWTVGNYCKIDNIKSWHSTASQIKELVEAGSDTISFEQIRGENTSADEVTKNLNLNSLIGTQTQSGLVILGWQSDNESVIATDGTVTRPAFQGDTATVHLTPLLGMVDTMHEGDGDYVTAGGAPITLIVPDQGLEPLVVAQTGYVANEDFTEVLTQDDHSRTIIPYIETYSSGGLMGEAEIQISSGTDGAATWVAKNKGGQNMMIPFQPGTVVEEKDGQKKYTPQPVLGEFWFEFDIERLSAVSGQGINFYFRNGSDNAAKLTVYSSRIEYYYYDNKTPVSYASASVSGEAHNIRVLLGTEGEIQYLGGLWIDGKEIAAKKQTIPTHPSDTGWKMSASDTTTSWVTGELCKIDNIKMWRSPQDQAKELAAQEAGKITFQQIQGQNTAAENVTGNLELKSGEAGALLTENKLLVMGWESDQLEIISESGQVTRPEKDTQVSLTPLLAIQDAETGAYVTVEGTPIVVTVKGIEVGFFDGDSNLVSILSQEITQGRADISGFSGSVILYAALYDGSRLEQIWTSEKVTAGESASAAVDITLPSELTGKTLKLFVWNGDTLAPLYSPAEVK